MLLSDCKIFRPFSRFQNRSGCENGQQFLHSPLFAPDINPSSRKRWKPMYKMVMGIATNTAPAQKAEKSALVPLIKSKRPIARVRFSFSGLPDASRGIYAETCRRFGIHRSYFYRWKKRSDTKWLSALENKPPVPKRKQEPEYSRELVRAARAIRKDAPSYSAKRIRPILLRNMETAEVPSAATIGRLINREHLFFKGGHETA
jgi:hypothetical protein